MFISLSLKYKFNYSKKNSDFIWHLEGNLKDQTEDIKIRVISVKLESGEFEYLITNVFNNSFTITMFRHLYFLRWPVEQKYYELKKYLQIEDFNGATTTAILQEFYIDLFLSNLSALIKGSADEIIDATNKFQKQVQIPVKPHIYYRSDEDSAPQNNIWNCFIICN